MAETVQELKARIGELESRVAELERNKQQLDLVIANTGVGIWDWYVQTGETIFNERWANIIGYTLEELSPVSIETWIKYAHPDDLEESNRLLKEHWAGNTEYYIFETRMKHKEGHWVWIYDTGHVIEWESEGVPKRMIGTHLDITEQKEMRIALDESNKKLEQLIRLDPLTKVPNRRAYEEQIKSALDLSVRSGEPLSLLMLDVDFFKQYNDVYGHESGDVVLVDVTRQIQKSLPRKTDFLARYGGEEFVVLLPSTPLQNAEVVAKNIINNVISVGIEHTGSKPYKSLTVSIGIASNENDPKDLLKHADEALYLAKKNGRNRYEIYSDHM